MSLFCDTSAFNGVLYPRGNLKKLKPLYKKWYELTQEHACWDKDMIPLTAIPLTSPAWCLPGNETF